MPVSNETSTVTPEHKKKGRGGFRLRRVIAALLIILLAVLTMAVFLHRALLRIYAPSILETLAAEFEEYYELDFRWEGYSITGINDFTITGISVADIPSSTQFLDVDSMRIRTSLNALAIRGQDPMLGVTSVELNRPVITLAREPDGRWNTGALLEPGDGEKYVFPGRLSIVIKDGRISWLGGDAGPDFPWPVSEITNLEGIFRLETDESMGISLEGEFSGEGVESTGITVQGSYDPEKYLINLILEADTFDLKLIKPIFDEEDVREIGGVADTRVSFLFGEDAGELDYSILGYGTISDGYVVTDFGDIEAEQITGDLHYSHESVFSTGLKGVIRDADIEVVGQVGGFGEEIPTTCNLSVKADGVPLAMITEQFPDMAVADVVGEISGRAEIEFVEDEEFAAIVSLSSNSIIAYGIPLKLESLDATYEDGVFDIRHAQVEVFDGTILGEGVIEEGEAKGKYHINADVVDFPAGKIEEYFPEIKSVIDLTNGRVVGEFTVTGETDSSPEISGLLNLNNIYFARFPEVGAVEISVPVEYSGNSVEVRGGNISMDGAGAIFEGVWEGGSDFSGNVALTVDDPPFISRITGLDAKCMLSSAGEVEYSEEGLGFDGEIFMACGSVAGLSIPNLSADLTIADDVATVSEIRGEINRAVIDGEIVIPLGKNVDGTRGGEFTVKGFDVGGMIPEKYKGLATTSIDLNAGVEFDSAGRMLVCRIDAFEDNAIVGPNMITTVDGSLAMTIEFPMDNPNDAVFRMNGRIESEPSTATVYEGRSLTEYSERVISHLTNLLTGEEVPEETPELPSIPMISGKFDIDTEINELFSTRSGSIQIKTSDAKVGWVNLSDSELSMVSNDGINWGIEVGLDAGDVGKLEVEGEIRLGTSLDESEIELDAEIIDTGIPSVLAMFGVQDPESSSGYIEGSGTIEGTLTDPFIENFNIKIGESQAFGIPLTGGNLNFSFDAPELDVGTLSIAGDEGFLMYGEGVVDLTAFSLTGADMVLRVDNVDLGAISSVMGQDIPFTGIGSAVLTLRPDAHGATILYDAWVEGLGFAAGEDVMPLGDLVVSAEYRPGDPQFEIGKIKLSKAEENITLSGKLPADFTDAGAELFDLSLISETGYTLSVPGDESLYGFTWEGGINNIDLQMTGSMADLVVGGGLQVDVRDIKYDGYEICDSFAGPLRIEESVGATSPEEFTISGEDWEIGVSSIFRLTNLRRALEYKGLGLVLPGQIKIATINLMQISAGSIPIEGPGFEMLVRPEMGEGIPSLELYMEQNQFGGSVAGNIAVMRGEVDIRKLPLIPPPDPEREVTWDIYFDVHAWLVEELRVQDGNKMNIVCDSAQVDVTGNLTQPVVTGKIYAPSGRIDVLENQFVLIEPLEMTISSFSPSTDPDSGETTNPLTDPHIRATARKTFREVRSPGFYGEELVITAHFDSRLSTMLDTLISNNGLTSEPPLSQDAIIQALAYENFYYRAISNTLLGTGDVDPGFDSIDMSTMLPLATSYLSGYIRREAGFTDFEISMDRDQNLLIYIEKEVFDDVIMFYEQKFGSEADNEHLWGVRYMWRARSWVGFEVDNDEEITPQIQYIIPLD